MIALRPLREADIPGMLEWMHDPAINCNFRFAAGSQTPERAAAFVARSMTDTDKHFAVVDETDTYLGTISLKQIDTENACAEYAISMRAGAQGKGFAAQATRAVLQKAFGELGLHRVYLNVLAENTRAQHLYEKTGFLLEGTARQSLRLRGEWKDLKWYAILKQDFEQET